MGEVTDMRFKQFEKKYAEAGREMHRLMLNSVNEAEHMKTIAKITHWDRLNYLTPYTQAEVQYAVYDAPTAVNWQIFRIGLKGLPTRAKLYMLKALVDRSYLAAKTAGDTPGNDVQAAIEERDLNDLRVDNYIGALVRGGQLSAAGDYSILK